MAAQKSYLAVEKIAQSSTMIRLGPITLYNETCDMMLKKDQLDCFKYFKSMINYCEIYFIESYVDTLNIIKNLNMKIE